MKTIKLLSTMKTIKLLSMLAFAGIVFTSCSDDDDPEEVHEEETITTMVVSLAPSGGGTTITLTSRDLDGDGFSNETESPAEDITAEVDEEGGEHQLIYEYQGAISSIDNLDTDGDGNDLGLAFDLVTGAAGSSTLTVTLRHEPTKPNDGTLSGAGGSTDFTATFSITVE